MNRTQSFTVEYLLACLLLPGSAFSQATHEVAGRVIDVETGKGLARARVIATLGTSNPRTPWTNFDNLSPGIAILTDDDGAFGFRNVPAGRLQLSADRAGYLAAESPRLAAGFTAAVVLQAGKSPAPVTLLLTKQAVLAGRFMGESGQALQVHATLYRLAPEKIAPLQPWGPLTVDRSGEFRQAGLQAGRYYVEVTQAFPDMYDPREKVYPGRFYPDTIDIQSAKPIDLTPGQEQWIEMRLHAVRGYEISGRIRAPSHPNLTLEPFNNRVAAERLYFANSWDEQTGAFKISGVPSGSYKLHANYDAGGTMIGEPRTVTVDGADVGGIVLEPSARK